MSSQASSDNGNGAAPRTNTQSEARASASWWSVTLAAGVGAFLLAIIATASFWT